MTIRELYAYAVENHCENFDLIVNDYFGDHSPIICESDIEINQECEEVIIL